MPMRKCSENKKVFWFNIKPFNWTQQVENRNTYCLKRVYLYSLMIDSVQIKKKINRE